MLTYASLVRADGTIHLHPIAAVDMDLAAVVGPRNPEHDHALGLDHPFQNLEVHQVGIRHHIVGDAFDYLSDRLVELALTGIARDEFRHELLDIIFREFVHKGNF